MYAGTLSKAGLTSNVLPSWRSSKGRTNTNGVPILSHTNPGMICAQIAQSRQDGGRRTTQGVSVRRAQGSSVSPKSELLGNSLLLKGSEAL